MKRNPPRDTVARRAPAKDLTGETFGRLTAKRYLGFSKSSWRGYWECECECGITTAVRNSSLTRGYTRSCGCLTAELAAQRQWKGFGELSGHYFQHIRFRAASSGILFAITIEEAWALYEAQEGRCALSGLEILFGRYAPENRAPAYHGRPRLGTASLDRIDSSGGYMLENVQWVHKEINRMKGSLSSTEFVALCVAVANQHDPASPEAGL